MDLNQLTQKSQEALRAAQEIARVEVADFINQRQRPAEMPAHPRFRRDDIARLQGSKDRTLRRLKSPSRFRRACSRSFSWTCS